MNNQDIPTQIDTLNKQVKYLERISIQENIDPTTYLYLVNIINTAVANYVALLPTQTYSTGTPSGAAPEGSIWFRDTGVLATREIYMYSGSGWVQFK